MPTDVVLSPADVRIARESLGLTEEALAAELGVVPGVVHGWEDGSIRASGQPAKVLAWRVALAAHERALTERGVRDCATANDVLARVLRNKATMAELDVHMDACTDCRARAAAVQELPPLPEYPDSGGSRVLVALSRQVGRLPAWLRPAAWGALLVGAMMLMRVILVIVAGGFSWRALELLALAIAFGAYLGAVGGIAFHLAFPRLRRLGRRTGGYLTGIVCVLACMLALFVPAAVFDGDSAVRSAGDWMLILGLSVLFGLVVGHFMRDR